MINLHTKFEMSKTTCIEDIKANAKCKNSRFEPPFGGLIGVTNRVYQWLDGKRIIDFPLVIIELFSLAISRCISETVQDRNIVTTEC